MADTAQSIINDMLVDAGIYAPGETVSDTDAEYCLRKLNQMLDSWSNENLACYAITEQSGALAAAKSTYTIGTSGSPDFNQTRPIRIISGPGTAYIQDAQGNPYTLDVYEQDKWNLLNRSSTIQSNIPTVLFYDPQFPLGKLNFWPQPNAAGFTAFWDSYLQLTDFAALTTAASLPPGYVKMIQTNLLLEVWSGFKPEGSNPSAIQIENARVSKANVKRSNIRSNEAAYDPEIVSRGQASYNWQ